MISKQDFIQVDSQWVYATGGFHMSLEPNDRGEFKLSVYGSIEPLPPATKYPTEPEWDHALRLANRFLKAYRIARNS